MLHIWDVADEDAPAEDASQEDKEAYLWRVLILKWYLCDYIPWTVGVDVWGPDVRPFKFMTDTVKIRGKDRMLVTSTSEAMSLLQFENSRDAWIATYKFKEGLIHKECDSESSGSGSGGSGSGQNPPRKKKAPAYSKTKIKPPAYNRRKPETHPYKGKWSSYKSGQQSAWHPDAYTRLEALRDHVQEFRQKEKDKGYPKYTAAKAMIREVENIKDDAVQPPKKKSKTSHVDPAPEPKKMTYLDE